MKLKPLRGMWDLAPPDGDAWLSMLDKAVKVLKDFGYMFVRTPVLERKGLFVRSVGESTDIVEKEMYEFVGRDGETLVLRPEETASIVRLFLNKALHHAFPYLKLFTFGPMFRYERPQKGRLREFYQLDVEFMGIKDPFVEVESILMIVRILGEWNVNSWTIVVNHLGCEKDRGSYKKALFTYLKGRESELCESCRSRLYRNVLRVLDCKRESCREVVSSSPKVSEFLCDDCRSYMGAVLGSLRKFGVSPVVDDTLVRGLDYYTGFVFEVTTPILGAQNAFIGGGRYDLLVEEFGGPSTPSFGFGIGIDRLFSALGAHASKRPDVFLCPLDGDARDMLFALKFPLMEEGFRVEGGYVVSSIKKLLRLSDRFGAKVSLILGGDEISKGVYLMRNMDTGEQREVPMKDGIKSLVKVISEWL